MEGRWRLKEVVHTHVLCNSPSNNVEYKAETGGRFHRRKKYRENKNRIRFFGKNMIQILFTLWLIHF